MEEPVNSNIVSQLSWGLLKVDSVFKAGSQPSRKSSVSRCLAHNRFSANID